MNKPVIYRCPDKIHCDGLAAALESQGVKFARWSDKEIIASNDVSNERVNLIVHHCAFTDGWNHGNCTLSEEQIKAWELIK